MAKYWITVRDFAGTLRIAVEAPDRDSAIFRAGVVADPEANEPVDTTQSYALTELIACLPEVVSAEIE